VSGGTVQAGGGIYVSRQADQELLALCRSSAAYVLTPRQMGKSSLMVRTAEVLKEQGIRTATVDLTKIGTQLEAEAWYLGLLTTIARPLGLVRQLMPWWKAHQHLGVTQRFTEFVEEILLTEITEQVVIFVDEIDTTLNLDFTDDFFIAIRSFYLARAENPDFTRLSFVLFGVATPSDLIRNPQRTPFNIGQRVDLTDFMYEEALPLAEGFNSPEADGQRLLQWVMGWTGGHPYLTQRLCGALAEENRTDWTEFAVAGVVSRIFLGAASKQDTNLQFVRDMLTRRSPDLVDGLTVYREVLQNRELVLDEEQSLVKSHLKLSGIVKRREEDAVLLVRNPIYREVFDRTWIREHLPVNWVKQLRKAAIFSGIIFLVGMAPLAGVAEYQRQRAVDALVAAENAKDAETEQRMLAEQRSDELEQRSGELSISLRQTDEARRFARQKWNEAEVARQEAEAAQQVAVEQRQAAEAARQAEAGQRQAAEVARQDEEKQRQIAEEQRQIALSERDAADDLRKGAELSEKSTEALLRLSSPRAVEGLILAMYSVIKGRELGDSEVLSAAEAVLFQAAGEVREQMRFHVHHNLVSATAVSPDERYVVSADRDGFLDLWDLQGNVIWNEPVYAGGENEPLDPFTGPFSTQGEVVAVAFSADGQQIISINRNGKIKRWQRASGELLEASEATTPFDVASAQFSEDGQIAVASLKDGSIAVKDTTTDSWRELLVNESEPPQLRVIDASIDETDEIVESASTRQDAYQFEGQSGQEVDINMTSEDFDPYLVVQDAAGETILEGFSGLITLLPASGTYTVLATHEGGEPMLGDYELSINTAAFNAPPILQETATLTDRDEMVEGTFQHVYEISGEAGQEVVIVMASEEFDTLLGLETLDGEVIDFNDDYVASSRNSKLTVELPDSGTFRLIATTYGTGETGTYRLQAHYGPAVQEPLIPEITAQLDSDDPVFHWLIRRGDEYTFTGWEGQSINVITTSENFSHYVSLKDASGNLIEESLPPLEELERSSTLRAILPESGTYTLTVASDSNTGGAYNIVVNPQPAQRISISTDNQRLVTGSSNGRVQLWDLQCRINSSECEPIWTPPRLGHQGEVSALAFSDDGQLIASGGADRTILLWTLAGKRIETLRGHTGDVLALGFSDDSKRIVSSGHDGTIRLWSTEGRQLGQPLRGHADRATVARFNSEDRRTAARAVGVQFSHDGQRIISHGLDQTFRIWDADVNVPFRGHSADVLDVAFSPNGELIASAGADGTVRLWDFQGNQIDSSPFIGHEAAQDGFRNVFGITFSPDGDQIASAGADGTVRLWDLQGNQVDSSPFIGHGTDEFGITDVIDVAFSPVDSLIASSGSDGTIRLWDLQGNQISEAFTGHEVNNFGENAVVGLVFSPDGQRLASSGTDGTIRLWNLQGNQISEAFTGHDGTVFFIAFSPDGQRIASAGADGTVRLWNLQGEQISSLEGHEDLVWRVAFSPDGERLASSSFDGTIRLWDLQGNQIGPPLTGHGDISADPNQEVGQFGFNSVLGLSFSPDGQRIVSAGGDGTIRLWSPSWEEWMRNACEQIQQHPMLQSSDISPDPEFEGIASEVLQACQARIWEGSIDEASSDEQR
ncbi:MAG: AAA-like domain-containing protein, partial [Cyanobacteria bacterium P01_H01_bin.152]